MRSRRKNQIRSIRSFLERSELRDAGDTEWEDIKGRMQFPDFRSDGIRPSENCMMGERNVLLGGENQGWNLLRPSRDGRYQKSDVRCSEHALTLRDHPGARADRTDVAGLSQFVRLREVRAVDLQTLRQRHYEVVEQRGRLRKESAQNLN